MISDEVLGNVKYVVDAKGKRTHIIISLKDLEELIEKVRAMAIIDERRDEEHISLSELQKRLYGEEGRTISH